MSSAFLSAFASFFACEGAATVNGQPSRKKTMRSNHQRPNGQTVKRQTVKGQSQTHLVEVDAYMHLRPPACRRCQRAPVLVCQPSPSPSALTLFSGLTLSVLTLW
eukprot:2732454-Rhodomonas_salina.3